MGDLIVYGFIAYVHFLAGFIACYCIYYIPLCKAIEKEIRKAKSMMDAGTLPITTKKIRQDLDICVEDLKSNIRKYF